VFASCKKQGHRQDVWEVVDDNHLFNFFSFLSSTDTVVELNSSTASDRGSIDIFAPSVNNAVMYA